MSYYNTIMYPNIYYTLPFSSRRYENIAEPHCRNKFLYLSAKHPVIGGQIQEFVPTVWFCNTFARVGTLPLGRAGVGPLGPCLGALRPIFYTSPPDSVSARHRRNSRSSWRGAPRPSSGRLSRGPVPFRGAGYCISRGCPAQTHDDAGG